MKHITVGKITSVQRLGDKVYVFTTDGAYCLNPKPKWYQRLWAAVRIMDW